MAESIDRPADIDESMAVGSRVSWGAILAGAIAAVASFLLLTLLGSAIGLSTEPRTEEFFGWGAIIWAAAASILAMFIGGWIASLCTAGESRQEAAIYGFVTWAVALGIMLWLVAAGVGAGLNTMMGLAEVAAAADPADWAVAARRAGVDQETINQWRQTIQNAPAAANQAAAGAGTDEGVRETARRSAWGALAGMVLSLAASICGALWGSRPAFHMGWPSVGQPRATVGSRLRPAH